MKVERSPKRRRACSSARRRGRRPQRNKTRFFVVVGGVRVQVASFFLLYVLLVFVIHPHSCSLPAILPLTQMRDVYRGFIPINNERLGKFLAACMRQRLSMALLFSHRSSRHQRAPMTTTSVVVVPATGKPHQGTIIISRHSHEASKAGCAGDGGWL